MFCRLCGAKLPDDSVFCTECGKPIPIPSEQNAERAQTAQMPQGQNAQPQYAQPQYAPAQNAQPQPIYVQPVYTQPVYTQPVYTQPVYAPPAAQPRAVPRRLSDPRRVGSPLFLIAVILMTLGTLWKAFGNIREIILYRDWYYSYDAAVYFYIEEIITVCVNIALVVAVWFAFAKSKSKAEPVPVGTALSFVRIVTIALAAVSVIIPIVDFVIHEYFYFWDLLPILVYIPLYVLAVISIGAIQKGRTNMSVVLTAIFCFIAATAEPVYRSVFRAGSFIFIISIFVLSSARILFGILLLRYNSAAKNFQRQ